MKSFIYLSPNHWHIRNLLKENFQIVSAYMVLRSTTVAVWKKMAQERDGYYYETWLLWSGCGLGGHAYMWRWALRSFLFNLNKSVVQSSLCVSWRSRCRTLQLFIHHHASLHAAMFCQDDNGLNIWKCKQLQLNVFLYQSRHDHCV